MARQRKSAKPVVEPQHDVGESSPLPLVKRVWNAVMRFKGEVAKLHVWILTAIGLLQPYAVGFFDAGEKLPDRTWAFYLAVLKITAPLTASLVILAVLVVVCWPNDDAIGGYLMFMCFVGALLLTGAMHVGNALGGRQVTLIEPVDLFTPVGPFVNLLLSYFVAYRGALFLSSVAIAGYAAFVVWRFIYRQELAELLGDEQPAKKIHPKRRAA